MEAATIVQDGESLVPLSERARPAIELLVVVGLLEAELWYLRAEGSAWLNVLAYGLIVATLGLSIDRRRKAQRSPVRLPMSPARSWAEVLAACLVLSAVLMATARLAGDSNETFEFVFLDKPPMKLLGWLVGKLGAALGQQLALQLFLWPVCFELTRSRPVGTLLAASIFGLIHLPSPILVAITWLAGLAWIVFYRRTGRVAPLVASHMILATLAHGALPERLTYDMRVGLTATADLKRFADLNDPKFRLVNRRLKENRASLKHFTSPEYFQAQGGDLPGFLRGLFRDVLGRPATEADLDFWIGRKLANPRVDIPTIFLASDEYAQVRERRADSSLRNPRR